MTSARFRPDSLPSGVPLLVVTRGARVESVHRGSVAVVAEDGRLVAAAGNPLQPVFLRSASKPFQLTPFLASGGEKRFRLTTEEIALAAASHAGEPFHTRTALGILQKGGFRVDDLHCGAHAPMREETARELAWRREKPNSLHNNCSGKHAAMLLACRMRGEDPKSYWK
ncbi:MAG TPA: asparaginase, partial [Thermoanaerobaculia bacterium]|nr:asparaginase [Thermoanaerobaculia bacterium]